MFQFSFKRFGFIFFFLLRFSSSKSSSLVLLPLLPQSSSSGSSSVLSYTGILSVVQLNFLRASLFKYQFGTPIGDILLVVLSLCTLLYFNCNGFVLINLTVGSIWLCNRC